LCERLERIVESVPAEHIRVAPRLLIYLAIASDERQPARLCAVRPPVGRVADVIMLVATRRYALLRHYRERPDEHRRICGFDELSERCFHCDVAAMIAFLR